MKKSIITALLITLCLGNVIAQKNDTSISKKINEVEKELNTVLKKSKAAGFAIAIVKGKEVLYAKGFGYRDLENKLPMTPNTVFAIGSTTKAFTASLIGILEDNGKVDLDESPRAYIPELKFFNAEMNNQITIKDLMTHRTGLPRHSEAWKTFETKSKGEFISRIAYMEPISSVRSKFRYNNFMYFVQSVVAEKLTKKSWEQNIEQSLFQPLQMSSSTANIEGLKNSSEAALGYYFDNGVTTEIDYKDIGIMNPAGGINSSVNDMSKWMIAWLNKGQYNGEQILPAKYVKEAMSSQMVISGRFPRKTDPSSFMYNYGYGWFIASYKGHYRVDHGGNIEGFTANIALYPADDLGIVVLSNQNRSGVPQIVTNIIADKIFDAPKYDWIGRLGKIVQQQTKVSEVAKIVSKKAILDVKSYTGSYTHKGYGTFDVVVKNDSLFAKFPSKTLWLNPVHPNVFDTYYVIDDKVQAQYKDTSINFSTSIEGIISGLEMELERTLDPIVFERTLFKTNQTSTAKRN